MYNEDTGIQKLMMMAAFNSYGTLIKIMQAYSKHWRGTPTVLVKDRDPQRCSGRKLRIEANAPMPLSIEATMSSDVGHPSLRPATGPEEQHNDCDMEAKYPCW